MTAYRTGIFVALLFLLLSSCVNEIEKVNLITQHDDMPMETTTQLSLIYSDSAEVKLRITAGKLERFEDDRGKVRTELTDGVKVFFYNDTMGVETQLNAGEATQWGADRRMEARSGVIVINRKKERLETEKLTWLQDIKKITTDDFVKITTADEIIYGDGMIADEDFTNFKIKNIKGTIALEENDSTIDTADTL